MITRDSLILSLVVLGSVAGYFATLPTPWLWDWAQWMNCIVFTSGLIAAKLSSSMLAGANTPQRETYRAWGGLLRMKDTPKDITE
jgi:hypothetical protein